MTRLEPGTLICWKRTAFHQYNRTGFPQIGKVISCYKFDKVLAEWNDGSVAETLRTLVRPVPPLIALAMQSE